MYDKTFLECCVWTLETHPDASWAYTDTVNFGAREFLWRKWYDPEWEKRENILTVSACVRKDDLLEVGCFGIKEKRVYEDWYLWLKLIKAGKYPVRMSSLLTYYRQKEGTSELKESTRTNKKNAMRIIEKIRRDVVNYNSGIQFPKYDYNWESIVEENRKVNLLIEKATEDDTCKRYKRKCYGDYLNALYSNEKSTNSVRKVNILMIIPWMVTGGADRFNLNLVKMMDREKFGFTIITTSPATNEWRTSFGKYATVYDLTTFLDMKDWVSFINYIIKKNKINMIFNSNSVFGYKIIPYLKAKHPNIPIVDYVHMEEWYWRNGGFSRNSSINQNVIDKTFTCNENSRRIFLDYFNRKESEIETVYIGVDEKKFNPDNFDRVEILKKINDNKLLQGKYVISYICRIAEQKRPYLFIEVIKSLAKLRNDFVVVVVGDGPLLDGMKKVVIDSKVENFFVFLGNQKETEQIYKISDLTVNTSIKEGLALTSYESLAMGVPVVSCNVGGQKELINEDVGVIVPCLQKENEIINFNYSKKEINGYVRAIQKVLKNLNKYKTKCRKRILENYTIEKTIKIMEKELFDVAQNPNKQKIQRGKELANNVDTLKELITSYLVSCRQEYEWLSEEFNRKNVHRLKKTLKRSVFYEHTLEYKLKHPVVMALRKMGVYENLKSTLGLL